MRSARLVESTAHARAPRKNGSGSGTAHQGLATRIYARGPLVSDPFKPAATLAEAVQLGGAPPLSQYDATALLEAFPLDLATGCHGGPRKRSARAEPLGANRARMWLSARRSLLLGVWPWSRLQE